MIAIREALRVDHVQNTVAKPSARPSSSRAISWIPSRSGLRISSPDIASRASSLGSTA